jgi:hypothetical protein
MPSRGISAKLPGAALAKSKSGRLKNIRACATQSAPNSMFADAVPTGACVRR